MIPNLNKEELNNMLARTKGKTRISGFIGETIAHEVLVRGLHFSIYRPPSLTGSFPRGELNEEQMKMKISYDKDFWGDKYDSIKNWGDKYDLIVNWDNPYVPDLVMKKDNEICFVKSNLMLHGYISIREKLWRN